jgi:hypothetical protein
VVGDTGLSFRQVAEEIGVARSTLQHWLQCKSAIDAAPELVEFFESPIGVAFLHRLVLAAHYVMTLAGPCGIRLVCLLLKLTGIDQFVASSYGCQQQVSAAMQEAIVKYGDEEKAWLALRVALENRKKQARKEVEEAKKELNRKQEARESYLTSKHGAGRPPGFDKQIQSAQDQVSEAEKALEIAEHHRDAAKEAIRGIAEDYHPYTLETGQETTAEEVATSLNRRFSEMESIAMAANLSENSVKRIEKAKRVVGSMVATIAFFYMVVRAKVEACV